MACPEIEDIINKFESYTQKPVNYLKVQTGVKEDLKHLVKSIYDFTKSEENKGKKLKKSALPELIVQDFDEEQIWQQIELQNSECWDQIVWEVANCMSGKSDLVFPIETSTSQAKSSENDSAPSGDEEEDEEEVSGDNIDDVMEEVSRKSAKPTKEFPSSSKKIRPSIVDDKFFKLQEMEKFLLKEEKNNVKAAGSDSDSESIDMFEDVDDDEDSNEEEGSKDVMYTDFFDSQEGDEGNSFDQEIDNEDHQNGGNEEDLDENDSEMEYEQKSERKKDKKITLAEESSDDDSGSPEVNTNKPNVKQQTQSKDEKKSEFELRQQRLQQHITRLEEKTLNEAPWQLKGEVDASKRPQNSLLQEVVDFDLTSRPAPIITEQTTVTLEDIIRRRIKDKAWDDVVRKEKPVDDQLTFRKPEILDQSKSKLSLAQVYEAEYLKQKQALLGDVDDEKEPESHLQIKDAMSKLFSKLDALCHYHYTPKAPQVEVKIVSNTPAISMEEVAPVATSDAALLAPEEVKKKRRGELITKEERTQTDKNRERRKKKKLQKSKGVVEKVTDNRNTKKAVEVSDKSLKTSKAFFQQLNDNSASLIKSNSKRNVKNKGQ